MDSAGSAVRPVRDRRAAANVGRHARLDLVFARRAGRTVLAHAYAEPPFRIGRAFPDGQGVRMILAWCAPGIFGGDVLEQHVRVERGARVRLTSQSAMQAHPSADGAVARTTSVYRVEDEGELVCHWDPLIPFADAQLEQQIDIGLGERASLVWSDAFMAGRVGSRPASAGSHPAGFGVAGERWAFADLSHELRIARGESLEYLERYRIAPRDRRVDAAWIAGASSHIGTIVASGRPVDARSVTALHEELAKVDGVHAAADRLDGGLAVVRLMADSGVPFREARNLALQALARSAPERVPSI